MDSQVIAPVPNVQVCHHPESTHPIARGNGGRWVGFGDMDPYAAAIKFAKMISLEVLHNNPIRVQARYEHNPTDVADLVITLGTFYTVGKYVDSHLEARPTEGQGM